MRTVHAKNVTYDHSMQPKDINLIMNDIDAKISHYKPDEVLLSNMEVDSAAAEAAFTAIFAPKSNKIFVWLNQYQVEQTAKKVAGWFGFSISSSSHSIYCSCGKPHSKQPTRGPSNDNDFHGIVNNDCNEIKKRSCPALSSISCPFLLTVSHVKAEDRSLNKIEKPVKIASFNFKHNHPLNKQMLINQRWQRTSTMFPLKHVTQCSI